MLLHQLSRLAFRLTLWGLGGYTQVFGLDNLPDNGPYLIVTNHLSVADSVMVLLALPPIKVRFLISKKWENLFVLGPLMKRLGGIYLDRTIVDRQAIDTALTTLQQGGIVGLAPEGTRSPIQQMIKPLHGAAYLATRHPVPIIPIGLVNTDQLFHNFLRLRRTPIEIRIGPSFTLPPLEKKIKSTQLVAYTDYIMLHIAKLLPARYHGYYHLIQHRGLPAILHGEDPWPHCTSRVEKERELLTKIER